ncbi:BTB/POZ domain-containing protein [Rhizophagus clarus]|uniref:BTB/POZ domain-containing protein n=1 Tax=Rhizophagus clarus TaxID=94130 RepID=A0A8H3L2V4_9GLOM|nr:BTB/POZ domain-containing protein [Rhizophagus clarus]
MVSKFWSEFMKDFEKLFENKENYDVIIQAGEEPNIQEIYAHSVILCCHSIYFRSNLKEKKDGKFIFKKSNIPPKIFENILRFLYCGKINLNVENVSDILTLLTTANEFELNSLVKHIQEFLIDNQKEFIQNNAIKFLENIFQSESFELIRNYSLEIICETPDLLFERNTFLTLSSQMIEFILKQENLAIDEIEIWNNLIKWSYAQNPNIVQDPTKWSKDDIEVMKRTTYRLIPLIRFQDIFSGDYYEKVFPFEELLPKKLKGEIMQFYLVPNSTKIISSLPSRSRRFKQDSTIIESQHFSIFASWIEKENNSHYNIRNIPYKFSLLYRASRDEQIVGGYNPLDWVPVLNNNDYYYKSTNNSFVFSFTDKNNLQTAKISYPKDSQQQYSIYGYSSYGPAFGGGHDLLCQNGGICWSHNPHTYSIDLPRSFNVNDYEVFQVIKNK